MHFKVETQPRTQCTAAKTTVMLTINKFSDGTQVHYGKSAASVAKEKIKETDHELPNLYEYKLKRLFRV